MRRERPGTSSTTDPETIDARRFERLVEEGTRQLREGDPDGGAEALRTALRLWRGPALSDFAYEEFAQPYIRRFHDLHLDAIEQVAAAELEAGRAAEVVPMLDAAIREDPLRERSRELLMLALYRSGRHAESLRTYQQLRTTLVDELGLDPSPSLQRLQERILLHDPSLLPQPEQPAPEASHRNPYKGLRSFTEADAADFFGRDALVERLVRRAGDGLAPRRPGRPFRVGQVERDRGGPDPSASRRRNPRIGPLGHRADGPRHEPAGRGRGRRRGGCGRPDGPGDAARRRGALRMRRRCRFG